MNTFKFDPRAWVEAKKGEALPCGPNVRVRLEAPGAVEVDIGGGWRLVGFGSEMRIALPWGGMIRCQTARMAVDAGLDRSVVVGEAPFTNLEKVPGQSSVEQMIARAGREREIRLALREHERRLADKKHRAKMAETVVQMDDDPLDEPDDETLAEE